MFDLEADGFVEDSTQIHCGVVKDLYTGEKFKFYEDTLDDLTACLNDATTLIGHHIIGYDLDMLEKFYQWLPKPSTEILDTLVYSQVLNPDRQLPKGCPTSMKNPLTGKLDKITPHSVAAWGYRVGRGKPEHYDWSTFSMDMLHRCDEDVEIQILILRALLKEAGIPYEELFNVK